MNTPLLTWIVVISSQILLLVAFIIHHFNEKRRANVRAVHTHRDNRHNHILTVGSEREEFFCPGDRVNLDSHDWNNQEYD